MSSSTDVIYALIFIVVFGFCAVIGAHLYSEVNQGFQDSGYFDGVPGEVLNDTQEFIDAGLFDNTFLIMFVSGCIISLIVLAFGLGAHPAYLIAYIIALIAEVLVSIPLANAYYEFTQNSLISGTAATFTITNYILYNLPLFIFMVGIIVAIVIYGVKTKLTTGSVSGI